MQRFVLQAQLPPSTLADFGIGDPSPSAGIGCVSSQVQMQLPPARPVLGFAGCVGPDSVERASGLCDSSPADFMPCEFPPVPPNLQPVSQSVVMRRSAFECVVPRTVGPVSRPFASAHPYRHGSFEPHCAAVAPYGALRPSFHAVHRWTPIRGHPFGGIGSLPRAPLVRPFASLPRPSFAPRSKSAVRCAPPLPRPILTGRSFHTNRLRVLGGTPISSAPRCLST